jgi:hypothetical protein
MAFTTPGTAVAGEVLTAAFWNEQVRDNLSFLYTPPMCIVSRSSALTYVSAADIAWNSEDIDTNAMFDSGASTKITIKTAGVYIVTLNVQFAATSVGASSGTGTILVGGAERAASTSMGNVGGSTRVNSSLVRSLSVNDEITSKFTFAGAAGTLTIATTSFLSAVWIAKS